MELNMTDLLNSRPEVLLFLVIGAGYLIGKINLKGIELGSAGGVLFAALFFGHFGFTLPRIIETVGFIFFIYSVGFQSGPRFLQTFRQDGFNYIVMSLTVAVTGFVLAVLLSFLFDLEQGYAAGILGGGMTSTATLAAAQDAVNSNIVTISPGITADQVNANITVGYATTYLFGMIGLILFMGLFPKVLKINLPQEAESLAKSMKLVGNSVDDDFQLGKKGLPTVRIFIVNNSEIFGKTLDDVKFLQTTGCVILKMKRGERLIDPGIETQLLKDDKVATIGYFNELKLAHELLGGAEVQDNVLGDFSIETQNAVLSSDRVCGLSIRDAGIINRYSCFITKLTRAGVEMPVSPELVLEKGDLLVLTGISSQLAEVISYLGYTERPVHETDLLTFAFGIVGGIIVGTITITFGTFSFGIGSAGGLLIFGLLIGYLRSRHPTFGRVPRAARFILMEMGILFFLAGVGLRAGQGLIDVLMTVGVKLVFSGAVITVVPVIAGFLVGTYFLKMNPVILLGAINGAMTSTPSLVMINRAAKSSLPALGYAGAYAFSNVVLAIAGQFIMML